jgi:ABC-type nitrate/sulfonate/bicarbonate transport system substrate-binding protein
MNRVAFMGTMGSTLAAAAAPVPSRAATPFVIGSLAGASDAAVYYPLQQGWFTAAGLDVTVQPISAGPVAMAGVVGGSMQTADGNVLSLAEAYSKGIPVVLIAAGASWTSSLPTSVSLVAGPAIGSPYVSIAPTFLVTAFFAYRPWVEAHRHETAAFASVYMRGAAYSNVHHEELLPMVSSFSHVPLDALQRTTYAPVPAAGLDPALIQPVIDAAAKYHVIPRSFPAKDFILSA